MLRPSHRSLAFAGVALALLLALMLSGLPAVTAQGSSAGVGVNLFYMARRVSQLEPCGCKTKQRGGIFYEAALYDQHADAPQIRVDAGEFTKPQINDFPVDSYRTRFLLRGLTMLQYDAVNLGLHDLGNHAAFYESVIKETPAVKDLLISANIFQKGAPDQLAFPAYKVVERELKDGAKVRLGIIGATAITRDGTKDPKREEWLAHDYIARPAAAALEQPLAEMSAASDVQVLLFCGSYDETMALAKQYPGLDFIITTGRFPDSTMPLYIEGTTRLLQVQNTQAKELGYVKIAPDAQGAWLPVEPPQSLAVAVELPVNTELKALSDDFTARIRAADQAQPASKPGQRSFAGGARCLTCHASFHKDWDDSAHAHALATLNNTGDQFRRECVVCHTTGAEEPNGFVSVNHGGSRSLFNVQCEACHGPAREHADIEQRLKTGAEKWMKPDQLETYLQRRKEVMPPKAVPEQVCIRCHDAANDPTFNYANDLPLVSHAAVPKPQAQAGQGQAALPPAAAAAIRLAAAH